MKDIGIRELKKNASALVRHLAEGHAVYTITRRGKPVGILAPPDHLVPSERAGGPGGWARLEALADRMNAGRGIRKSAVRELHDMRR
jgi:prevent-host-death family protein